MRKPETLQLTYHKIFEVLKLLLRITVWLGYHGPLKVIITPTRLIDQRLTFGARHSPSIFNELTHAVCRIMAPRGFSGIVCYLDDFFIVSLTSFGCLQTCLQLLDLLRQLVFAIKYNKLEGQAQWLIFLGIEIDTIQGVLRLHKDKLDALLVDIKDLWCQKSVSKCQLHKCQLQ